MMPTTTTPETKTTFRRPRFNPLDRVIVVGYNPLGNPVGTVRDLCYNEPGPKRWQYTVELEPVPVTAIIWRKHSFKCEIIEYHNGKMFFCDVPEKQVLMPTAHTVRFWRGRRLMTATDLAKSLKIGPQALYKIENGLQTPHIRLLARMARVLNVPADTLLGLQEATPC